VLLAPWLAYDSASLFSGRGISATTLAPAGRVAAPILGVVLGVVVSRLLLEARARLRAARRVARLGAFGCCLIVAGLALRVGRLPQLQPYLAIERYCEVIALGAILFGLASSDRLASLPDRLPARGRLALAAGPVAMVACLPLLFPSSRARLALASRSFVASPVSRGLRKVFDFDRDGYSPLLGGGDCDDLDPRVHPFTRDVPGDGVDQDCDGVDGWTADPLDPRPPYGPRDAPAANDLRARARGRNVLLVLVDSLRFDRLDGPRVATFPHLARLRSEGFSFARALSPASRTPLAMPVLLGGGAGGGDARLLRTMHAAGMRVGFASVDVVIDQLALRQWAGGDVDLIGVSTEGDRSLWGGGIHVVTGRVVTESALRWVDGRGADPWMLWVHYFSAHQWDSIDAVRSIPGLPERYDAALVDDDRAVGALLDGLTARGLAGSTVVVMLADHGESLGDHGWRTHGAYLFPELVHVPFVIAVPGAAGRSIGTVVPTAALTPTLLDLLSIEPPAAGDVESLVPLMAGTVPEPDGAARPIVMRDTSHVAIVMGNRLLRFRPDENATEMLAIDELDAPLAEDLVVVEPEVSRRLSRQLVALARWQ
jgi:hypothetical protein